MERFYERIDPLVRSPKMGPVLWQLPENFHRNDERLASALASLPPGRHCFEFRHPSWFLEEVYAVLREERELEEWTRRIEGWRESADAYAYFNNDSMGYAVKNGFWLKKRLGA